MLYHPPTFRLESISDSLLLAHRDAAMSLVFLHGIVELGADQALAIARHEPQAVHKGPLHKFDRKALRVSDRQFPLEVLEVVGASPPMITLCPAPNHLNEVQLAVVLRIEDDRTTLPAFHFFSKIFFLIRKVRLFA